MVTPSTFAQAPTGVVADLVACLRRHAGDDDLDVPPLSRVANQVLTMTQNQSIGLGSLAKVIESDAILCARVLQVANSPMYGAGANIVSIRQAVARLGTNFLAQTATSIAIKSALYDGRTFKSLLAADWYESILRALTAKEIARARQTNLEEAFLAGLLHRIGRPCAYYLLGKFGPQPLAAGPDVQAATDPVEPWLGELVARRWNLPYLLIKCASARTVEQAEDFIQPVLTAVVANSVMLAFLRDGEQADRSEIYAASEAQTLGLYAQHMDAVWQALPTLSQVAQVFH